MLIFTALFTKSQNQQVSAALISFVCNSGEFHH